MKVPKFILGGFCSRLRNYTSNAELAAEYTAAKKIGSYTNPTKVYFTATVKQAAIPT